MPTFNAITVTTRNAGTYRSASIVVKTAECRFKAQISAPSWAEDITKSLSFGMERSFDNGATWKRWISGETWCGRVDKNGEKPWVMVWLHEGDVFLVRAFVSLNNSMRVGLNIESVEGTRKTLEPPPVHQSWASAGRKSESGTGGASPITFALDSTAAGNFLAVASNQWGANAITVTDDINGAYSQAFEVANGSLKCGLHYKENIAGGDIEITVTSSSASAMWAAAHEFSGGASSSSISGTPVTATEYGATSATGSFSPPDNDVLLLAVSTVDLEIATITENAGSEGFTLSNEHQEGWEVGSFVYKIMTGAPGTVSESWSHNSQYWCCGIAAFKKAAGTADALGWLTDGGSKGPLPHHLDKGVFIGY